MSDNIQSTVFLYSIFFIFVWRGKFKIQYQKQKFVMSDCECWYWNENGGRVGR